MISNALPRLFWLLGMIFVAIAAAVSASLWSRTNPGGAGSDDQIAPPVLFTLPVFTLEDQNGRPFGSADLAGKVWVVDFIFTRCPGVCQRLSKNLAALQAELRHRPQWDRVRLVSISVDTEHDTSRVLKRYADQYGADPDHWFFLTGPRQQVWSLITSGFRQGVEEDPQNTVMPFTHSSLFALVDQRSQVRSYHDSQTAEDRAELMKNLEILLSEP